MKFATAAVSFHSLVLGAFGLIAPRTEYNTFIPSWEVEVRPGETVVLNGTVQEVHAELLKRNPNLFKRKPWNPGFGRLDSHPGWLNHYLDNSNSDLTEQSWPANAPKGIEVVCGRWTAGNTGRWDTILIDAAHYLDKYGWPRTKAGPGSCGQVSCEWNTAVWWCNDSPEPKILSSWEAIAAGVAMIYKYSLCFEEKSAQVFNPDNWNLIVSGGEDLEC